MTTVEGGRARAAAEHNHLVVKWRGDGQAVRDLFTAIFSLFSYVLKLIDLHLTWQHVFSDSWLYLYFLCVCAYYDFVYCGPKPLALETKCLRKVIMFSTEISIDSSDTGVTRVMFCTFTLAKPFQCERLQRLKALNLWADWIRLLA